MLETHWHWRIPQVPGTPPLRLDSESGPWPWASKFRATGRIPILFLGLTVISHRVRKPGRPASKSLPSFSPNPEHYQLMLTAL